LVAEPAFLVLGEAVALAEAAGFAAVVLVTGLGAGEVALAGVEVLVGVVALGATPFAVLGVLTAGLMGVLEEAVEDDATGLIGATGLLVAAVVLETEEVAVDFATEDVAVGLATGFFPGVLEVALTIVVAAEVDGLAVVVLVLGLEGVDEVVALEGAFFAAVEA
jgi:hypothetical protein